MENLQLIDNLFGPPTATTLKGKWMNNKTIIYLGVCMLAVTVYFIRKSKQEKNHHTT